MKLLLNRIARKSIYTISRLYCDIDSYPSSRLHINESKDIKGYVYLCDVLEDTSRGLKQGMKLSEIQRIKQPKYTAIPTGTYTVTLKIQSPKFSAYSYYMSYCKAYLPRLLNVDGYEGILIHGCFSKTNGWCNCTNEFTDGCLVCGFNTITGKLTDSKKAFENVYEVLLTAKDEIKITITE